MPYGMLGPSHREAYHDDFWYSRGGEKELYVTIPASGWLMAITVRKLGNGPDMLCTLKDGNGADIDMFMVYGIMTGGGIWKPLINVNAAWSYRLKIVVDPKWVEMEPGKEYRLPKLVIGHTSCWRLPR